jgi:hypothetical protein
MNQASAIELYNRVAAESKLFGGAAICHNATTRLDDADSFDARSNYEASEEEYNSAAAFLRAWADALEDKPVCKGRGVLREPKTRRFVGGLPDVHGPKKE